MPGPPFSASALPPAGPAVLEDFRPPPGLAELMAHPAGVSPGRLWLLVPGAERVRAVRAALEEERERPGSERGELTRELREAVAGALNLRPRTVAAWTLDRLAERAGTLGPARLRPEILLRLLRALHLAFRRPLMSTYLDHLGIPHDDGILTMEVETAVAPERARDALLATAMVHPPEEALGYVLLLARIHPRLVAGIETWLPGLVPPDRRAHAGDEGEDDVGEAPAGPMPLADLGAEALEALPSFTTLDGIVIRAVVNAQQEVEGSLELDRVEDLVLELLGLNSSRHRSFFHLGFLDGVRERPRRAELPAENDERRRWYLAGLVSGLGRRRRWTAVTDILDAEPLLRGLARGDSPAGRAALPVLGLALLETGRTAELPGLLPPAMAMDPPWLGGRILDQATALLREGRAGEARPLLRLLRTGADDARERGEPAPRRFELEVKRRQAHVHRQLGEREEARALLEALLEDDPDPAIQAMVWADLGLVEGGFRSLADIRIPIDEAGRAALLERLEQGSECFRRSAGIPSRFGGHGHYGLGMIEALRPKPPGSWEQAAHHLERALLAFESFPGRYDTGVLLPTARLQLGIALALTLEVSRAPRAFDLLEEAVAAGNQLRGAPLGELLEALHLLDAERAGRLAEALVQGGRGPVLDAVVRSPLAATAPTLAAALHQRGMNRARGASERAGDLRDAVPLLLRQSASASARGDHHAAGEALKAAREGLDSLEELAMAGVGRDAFLELLEDASGYEPAWGAEEVTWARVHLLEAQGRYPEAVELLEAEFHRVLSQGAWGAEDDAEAILARIRATGPDGRERAAALTGRLEAFRATMGNEAAPGDAAGDGAPATPVRVLFVGGDERQAREQDAVRDELRRTHPHIEVSFVHPGWAGNWSSHLDEVRRKARSHDAAVIMRYVRTEFGRAVRRELEIPWRSCEGAGRRTMVQSIVQAALAARR